MFKFKIFFFKNANSELQIQKVNNVASVLIFKYSYRNTIGRKTNPSMHKQ